MDPPVPAPHNDEQARPRGFFGWFIRHPKTSLLLLLLLMAFGLVLSMNWGARRALDDKLAELRARGEPVDVSDLIARQVRIPDEENMFVAVAAAARKIAAIKIDEQEQTKLLYVGLAEQLPTGRRWSYAELETGREYVLRAGPALQELRHALRIESCAYRVRWSRPALDVPMPELSDIRFAARWLALSCQSAAQGGERTQLERELLALMSMNHVLQHDGFLLTALVQTAINSLGQDTIERAINLAGLSDPTLAELDKRLFEAESHPSLHDALRIERATVIDTILWLREGNPLPQSLDSLVLARQYIPAFECWELVHTLGLFENLIASVETPGPQTLQTAAALPAMIGQLPWYCQFASIGMSSLSQAMTLWVRYVGQTRALRAALAAERYRLANDRWPDRLENLVPQFIDAVPIDPVDNRPIRYAVISEGIKTWTIAGDDQNLDDGGDVRRLEPRDPNIRPKDYGWIILIPSLRYRPAEGDTKHPVSSSQSAGESNRD